MPIPRQNTNRSQKGIIKSKMKNIKIDLLDTLNILFAINATSITLTMTHTTFPAFIVYGKFKLISICFSRLIVLSITV